MLFHTLVHRLINVRSKPILFSNVKLSLNSVEEKERAEKLVPRVILQCFTVAQIHELQLIAEKIIQDQLKREQKVKQVFLPILKAFSFKLLTSSYDSKGAFYILQSLWIVPS